MYCFATPSVPAPLLTIHSVESSKLKGVASALLSVYIFIFFAVFRLTFSVKSTRKRHFPVSGLPSTVSHLSSGALATYSVVEY